MARGSLVEPELAARSASRAQEHGQNVFGVEAVPHLAFL